MNIKKNTIWNIAESIIGFLVGLSIARSIISLLGIDQYGLFVILSMLSGYGVISLFDLGMTGAIISFASQYRNIKESVLLTKLWVFSIIFYFIIACLAVLTCIYIVKVDVGSILTKIDSLKISREIIFPALLLTFISFTSYSFIAFIQSYELYRYLQIINITGHLCRAVSAFYFISSENGLLYFLYAIVSIRLIQTAALFLVLILLLKDLRRVIFPEFSLILVWLKYSTILFGSALVGFFMNMFDKLLITAKLPFGDVGFYDVINKPANGLRMGLAVLYSAVEPATVRIFSNGGKPAIKRFYLDCSLNISVIIIPLIITSFLNMRSILSVWLGDDQISDNLVYATVCAGIYVLLIIQSSIANIMLVAIRLGKKILPIQIFTAIVVVILMLLSIDNYGIWGCIISILIGYLISSFMILKIFYFYLEFKGKDILTEVVNFIVTILLSIACCLVGHFVFDNDNILELLSLMLCELLLIWALLYLIYYKNKYHQYWLR